MTKQIVIVDYGIGNICSVSRAFEKFGTEVRFASTGAEILSASALVLPGVGAFAHGMAELRERGLVDSLLEYSGSGRPLLGICLGMQLLLSGSKEFGEHEGLGVIPGEVLPIQGINGEGSPLKIPHIGWSELVPPQSGRSWENTLLAGIEPGTNAYFVHSFAVHPQCDSDRLADVEYGDQRFSAMIQRGNVAGCQFHPEKSGPAGLKIIENFLATS